MKIMRRTTLVAVAAAAALTLAACAHDAPPQVIEKVRTVDTGCEWTKPIYVSKADVLTDETAKDILAHNKAGAARCGWKPVKKAQ